MLRTLPLFVALLLLPLGPPPPARASEEATTETVLFPSGYALSPDGATLVFAWRGDLWRASATGGACRRLTFHPAAESQPHISPDGTTLAFVSTRSGTRQVWVMPLEGGIPRRITTHTESCRLEGFFPDGRAVLMRQARDHDWRDAERLFRRPLDAEAPATLLFDAHAYDADVSPDGTRIAFVREGVGWTRKGYRGSQAAQIWIHDLESGAFRKISEGDHGERNPRWLPDGRHLLLASEQDGAFNLYRHDVETGAREPLTAFADDGVVLPTVSADGSLVVFRRLEATWRMAPGTDVEPHAIGLEPVGDPTVEATIRREVKAADAVAFSLDAREIAFVAGGDVWVMDTELREPVQVTDTPEEERGPVFAPDQQALYFVRETDAQPDIWVARRADPERWWWQSEAFELERLTDDAEAERALSFTPDAKRLAYVTGAGDLWWMRPDGSEPERLVSSWNGLEYSFSPDGRWLAYAKSDEDFNRDVWIVPTDGSRDPVNVSRHPDNDRGPVFSPDGRLLAFTGRRWDDEVDIYYVWLRKEDDERSKRDRTLEKALEAMKGREKKKRKKTDAEEEKKTDGEEKPEKEAEPVRIDLDGIAERIRRISIPNTSERSLVWMGDDAKLAFQATVDGADGLYTVTFPDALTPKRLTGTTGRDATWLPVAKKIGWLVEGKPATLDHGGRAKTFGFSVRQIVDVPARHRAAFDMAWRIMRDHFYDARLNGRDWDAVRSKYRPLASRALAAEELESVVDLMLGELNGSHLNFSGRRSTWSPTGWRAETGHLGLRFDRDPGVEGLVVRDVVPETPADRKETRILAGETVLTIDGEPVDADTNVARILTGDPDREVAVRVRAPDGAEREVRLRPVRPRDVRRRLYDAWLDASEVRVEERGEGRLGYLHVRGMNWSSFQRFEEALYAVGEGRDGLVIDVRDNGGGFTTDHLLTCLTQPVHAFTVARGGAPGYPQDRMVYARWTKPIVVLVNQNSFSNAEIFAHAIRTLGRGPLVGVPTAGGVISTGRTNVMDVGSLRLPFRGWFTLPDGQDMERRGCEPDHVVWPLPDDETDRQLDRAVDVLLEEVRARASRPAVLPRYASERDAEGSDR